MSDPWGIEESDFNKLGTKVIIFPAIVAAMLLWWEVVESPVILFAVVSICGAVGGGINVMERAPLWAGAVCGLVMGLGGFGAVYWWTSGRESTFVLLLGLAFVIGGLPGYLLQHVFARMLMKKDETGAAD